MCSAGLLALILEASEICALFESIVENLVAPSE